MKSNNFWIIAAGILGFLGVAIGAFGAHVLESSLSSKMIETFNTGVQYHLIHSVVILAIALSEKEKYYISSLFFSIGIILFSFSLYIYSTTGITFLAMVTPFGGVSFLVGWGMLVWQAFRKILKNQ